MALPKPPKDYYSLDEIAKDWGWSVNELVCYAEQGKLIISAWFKLTLAKICGIEYDFSFENVISKKDIRNVYLDGVYPVLPSQLKELTRLAEDGQHHKAFDILYQDFEILNLRPGMTSFEPMEAWGPVKYGYALSEGACRDSCLVITHEEKIRFEKEHGMKDVEKSTGPRPNWFTVDQLAEEWRFSSWKIRHFIETGQLIQSEIFSSKESNSDVFHALSPVGWSEANKDEMSYQELHDDLCEVLTDGEKQYYIMLEEVERFEEEHGLSVCGFQERKTRLEEAQGQKPLAKKPSFHNSELLTLSSVQEEPCNTTPPTQEAFPGDPGEPALIGWRAIAPHMGLTVAKNGKKPKGMNRHIETGFFPLMEMPITGKPYTYLSQIKKYYAQIQKK